MSIFGQRCSGLCFRLWFDKIWAKLRAKSFGLANTCTQHHGDSYNQLLDRQFLNMCLSTAREAKTLLSEASLHACTVQANAKYWRCRAYHGVALDWPNQPVPEKKTAGHTAQGIVSMSRVCLVLIRTFELQHMFTSNQTIFATNDTKSVLWLTLYRSMRLFAQHSSLKWLLKWFWWAMEWNDEMPLIPHR